jgi:hypothetical protein
VTLTKAQIIAAMEAVELNGATSGGVLMGPVFSMLPLVHEQGNLELWEELRKLPWSAYVKITDGKLVGVIESEDDIP